MSKQEVLNDTLTMGKLLLWLRKNPELAFKKNPTGEGPGWGETCAIGVYLNNTIPEETLRWWMGVGCTYLITDKMGTSEFFDNPHWADSFVREFDARQEFTAAAAVSILLDVMQGELDTFFDIEDFKSWLEANKDREFKMPEGLGTTWCEVCALGAYMNENFSQGKNISWLMVGSSVVLNVKGVGNIGTFNTPKWVEDFVIYFDRLLVKNAVNALLIVKSLAP